MPILYNPRPQKLIEIILWLANREENEAAEILKIIGMLFLADILHLNRYGRPVSGDMYRATPCGPVPAMTYDLLRRDPLALNCAGAPQGKLPFVVDFGYMVTPFREPDLDQLSKSDVEALEETWSLHREADFRGRNSPTRNHPAWVEAAGGMIRYEDLLDEENRTPEIIEDLQSLSIYKVI